MVAGLIMDRPHRLREPAAFARLRHEGRATHHTLLILSFAPNGRSHNRYGFVTSKQVGGAVQRNRVRRWLRESVRALHPTIRPGYDIVIIAKRRINEGTFHDVYAAVRAVLVRSRLLNSEV